MTDWVYRKSDAMWMVRDVGDPSLLFTQPANYTLVTLDRDDCPDPRLTRGQAIAPYIRAATAGEIAAFDAAGMAFKGHSRNKDILTTLAVIVRAGNVSAWNAMTTAQKITATLALADTWASLRQWAEANL